MDYSATNMEYQDGLFYLYREDARYGVPLYSLVIKDINGDLVENIIPCPTCPKVMTVYSAKEKTTSCLRKI